MRILIIWLTTIPMAKEIVYPSERIPRRMYPTATERFMRMS